MDIKLIRQYAKSENITLLKKIKIVKTDEVGYICVAKRLNAYCGAFYEVGILFLKDFGDDWECEYKSIKKTTIVNDITGFYLYGHNDKKEAIDEAKGVCQYLFSRGKITIFNK